MATVTGGCAGRTSPRPPAPTVFTTRTDHVKDLCDYFFTRPLETLGTEGAQGEVNLLAGATGIPAALAGRAHDFYAGGITRPDTSAHRETLDARYKAVMRACRDAGWVAD